MLEDFDLAQIQDLAGAKQAILSLFNLVEEPPVAPREAAIAG